MSLFELGPLQTEVIGPFVEELQLLGGELRSALVGDVCDGVLSKLLFQCYFNTRKLRYRYRTLPLMYTTAAYTTVADTSFRRCTLTPVYAFLLVKTIRDVMIKSASYAVYMTTWVYEVSILHKV